MLRQINWTQELRDAGMPQPVPVYTNPRIEEARRLARDYVRLNGSRPQNIEVYENFYGGLRMLFMIELTKRKAARPAIQRVDEDLKVTLAENNPDLLLYWLQLNIPCRLDAVRKKVEEYLSSYGRGRYVLPTYRSLAAVDLAFARTLFQKYGMNYHPKIAEYISDILK